MLQRKIQTLLVKLGDYSKFLVILVTLFLGMSLYRNFSKVNSSQERIYDARERVEELNRENERLKKELRQTESEEFIEEQLRNQLNLSKEGEIVVVLPDEEIIRKLVPDRVEEEEILPDPYWKRWLKLFL